MHTISLCMIVKNEEDVIGRCLDSVKDLIDEMIIVDTGSTDRTKEIAARYTNRIYDYSWNDDFAAARNFSFSKATGDYIMWLDADDILSEPDRKMFLSQKSALDSSVSIVMMKYNASFDKDGNPTFSYYRERLMKRSMNHKWIGAVHEVIPLTGKIVYWDVAVTHKKMSQKDPDRNLRIFRKMISDGVPMDPRHQFYYGRELLYHGMFQEAADILEHFLGEKEAWLENKISACQDLFRCYSDMGRDEDAVDALLRSMKYDKPRAEVCCRMGDYFFQRQEYENAAYWYQEALECKMDVTSGGFFSTDCYGFLPAIQLCVCYDRLGNREKALKYHKMSEKYKPQHEAVLYNKRYFDEELK